MPRGGKRPGAGAKPGNLNALKNGRRSSQVQRLALLLASIPEVRRVLLKFQRRQNRQRRQAELAASRLLQALLERAAANDQAFVPILDWLSAQEIENSRKPSKLQSPTSNQSNPDPLPLTHDP